MASEAGPGEKSGLGPTGAKKSLRICLCLGLLLLCTILAGPQCPYAKEPKEGAALGMVKAFHPSGPCFSTIFWAVFPKVRHVDSGKSKRLERYGVLNEFTEEKDPQRTFFLTYKKDLKPGIWEFGLEVCTREVYERCSFTPIKQFTVTPGELTYIGTLHLHLDCIQQSPHDPREEMRGSSLFYRIDKYETRDETDEVIDLFKRLLPKEYAPYQGRIRSAPSEAGSDLLSLRAAGDRSPLRRMVSSQEKQIPRPDRRHRGSG